MESFFALMDKLNIWVWWSLAGLILIGELITGTTYLLWPAAAAFIVGGISLEVLGVPWGLQMAVFGVLTLALVFIGDRFVKPYLKSMGSGPVLNDRAQGMVGQRATVVVAFSGGQGRVQIGDSAWPARAENGEDFAEGDSVIITALDSTVLVVKRA
ncbi:NfeD family protein [Woodsholea maritima]|uniref:NfeD family protein n=1 Tax=Woodsholea maritima TaxID=240237 RepID=UPI000379BD83|nr:NfeD family protein [Woodsholea maritima]